MAKLGLELTPEYLIQVGNTVTLTYTMANTAGVPGAPYVWSVWGESVAGCITLSEAVGNTVKVTANAAGCAYVNVTIGNISGNFFVQSTQTEIVPVYQPDYTDMPEWVVGPRGGSGPTGPTGPAGPTVQLSSDNVMLTVTPQDLATILLSLKLYWGTEDPDVSSLPENAIYYKIL